MLSNEHLAFSSFNHLYFLDYFYFSIWLPLPVKNFRCVWGANRLRETISIRRMKTSVSRDETHISRQGWSAAEASTLLGISVSASSCV